MDSDEFIESAFLGFLAGLVVAICGAIKDAPYEGFDMATFLRSPLIGAVEAPIIASFFPGAPKELVFLSTIATERVTVEAYKIVRAKAGVYVPAKFTEVGEWGNPHWSQLKKGNNDE